MGGIITKSNVGCIIFPLNSRPISIQRDNPFDLFVQWSLVNSEIRKSEYNSQQSNNYGHAIGIRLRGGYFFSSRRVRAV